MIGQELPVSRLEFGKPELHQAQFLQGPGEAGMDQVVMADYLDLGLLGLQGFMITNKTASLYPKSHASQIELLIKCPFLALTF